MTETYATWAARRDPIWTAMQAADDATDGVTDVTTLHCLALAINVLGDAHALVSA